MVAKRSAFVGLGALLVLAVIAGLAFASDASPPQEPVGSPFFDATLQQAVDELDGKREVPSAGQAVLQQPTQHYTTDPILWPECEFGYTMDLVLWPWCHYTSDPNEPACDTPWPTQDYTWDALIWPECTNITQDPNVWCDPFWTSSPDMGPQCEPEYTLDPETWDWCDPRYTWDAALWWWCYYDPTYTQDPVAYLECGFEPTSDAYIWPDCHFTSDPFNLNCIEVPYPTQDYTSNPGLWYGCPVPDPEYTFDPLMWPWCSPEYTTNSAIWPDCDPGGNNYTLDPGLWPWCNPDQAYTTNAVIWPECHYTSDPIHWPACVASYPTRDYTWDALVWPECDPTGSGLTTDPTQFWCQPLWTTDPGQWPGCNTAWTWDPGQWPECEPGYTNDPDTWPECDAGLYTQEPATWPECGYYTADSRVWPECHFTSDPNSADCDGVWFPTKDYTTDLVLWPECDVPTGYTSDPEVWPECHYTSDPAAWPECEPQEELADLGDAPDSTNHPGANMTAYPIGGPPGTLASFPTVFDPATGFPQGPKHLFPRADAWLGPWVTLEMDADLLPDEDGVTNIDPPNDAPNKDVADDGVLLPVPAPHCVPSVFTYTVTITPGAPNVDRYVNVWFDWLRNGDWVDTPECPDGTLAPEWAVQDQLLAGLGPGTYTFSTPAYLPFNPTPDDPLWMRISIARQTAPVDPTSNLADGRGPANGYDYGETEDYYILPEVQEEEAGDLGDAPDSSNHAGVSMTAYPAGGPPGTDAHFPSVFDPATGLPQGPKHVFPRADIWLGPWVTEEADADLLPDEDSITNLDPSPDIPDRDGADDGLLYPVTIDDCVSTVISYTITITPGAPRINHYVNVWFDWNRDGDWADAFTCLQQNDAPEWAVQNQMLPVLPAGTYVFVTPAFLPYNPNPDEPLWMRISVAEGPAPTIPGTDTADGRGPDKGYSFGETEDYYLVSEPDPDYDIWIKDSDADDGSVPSPIPWWLSPDIWVRNDGDCTNTDHENPIGGTTTTICVRVRNRLATTVTNINVDLYWVSNALAITWPSSWSYLGTFNVPSLAGGATTVQSVPWSVPNITGHFCLLARADSLEDPIGSGPDTIAPVDRERNNNNIAHRNFNVVGFPQYASCSEVSTDIYTDVVYFDIPNVWAVSQTVDIEFDSADFPLGSGTIMVEPGALWGRWNDVPGFATIWPDTLEVTSFPATIEGVEMAPSEIVPVTMTIVAEADEHFTIEVQEIVSGNEVGGISWVRDLPHCIYLPVVLKTASP